MLLPGLVDLVLGSLVALVAPPVPLPEFPWQCPGHDDRVRRERTE